MGPIILAGSANYVTARGEIDVSVRLSRALDRATENLHFRGSWAIGEPDSFTVQNGTFSTHAEPWPQWFLNWKAASGFPPVWSGNQEQFYTYRWPRVGGGLYDVTPIDVTETMDGDEAIYTCSIPAAQVGATTTPFGIQIQTRYRVGDFGSNFTPKDGWPEDSFHDSMSTVT